MSSVALFSLIAVALVAVALAFLLPTLLRTRMRRETASRTAINAEIYRQEIDELNEEVVRGDLAASEAQPAREDLHRRLAEESRARPPAAAPSARTRTVALLVAVGLPLVAAGLYLAVGKPDALTDDAPPAAVGEAGEGDYVARLQSHLARQPRDGRGWVLLARAHVDRNEFKAASDAYQKALTVSEKIAKDPSVLCEYADALGMAQGGNLTGKPSDLVAQALAINPKHPVGLEMAGSAAYAEGRYADAARYWKELLAGLTPGSERHAELSAAVARAERKAAVSLPR
ncbi:MAG: c-type cytochrome biogenesis protein CcmI [Burkholderiaceae bacterium]